MDLNPLPALETLLKETFTKPHGLRASVKKAADVGAAGDVYPLWAVYFTLSMLSFGMELTRAK